MGDLNYVFDTEGVESVITALNARFTASCNEFLIVSYLDRIASGFKVPPDAKLALLPKDDSEWLGADEHWEAALKAYFGGM
jgi:hypothetical protein